MFFHQSQRAIAHPQNSRTTFSVRDRPASAYIFSQPTADFGFSSLDDSSAFTELMKSVKSFELAPEGDEILIVATDGRLVSRILPAASPSRRRM